MINIDKVSKLYGTKKALDDVSLSFEEGKIYGLLGRNGAGKSTLINIISNRIVNYDGRVSIDNHNAKENQDVHGLLFAMSEADYYDKSIKVKDHYKWTSKFYEEFNETRAMKFVKMFDLDINSRFNDLSKGYKSIFKITIALAMDVPYIIYDEPIQGLDANHRELFYKLLLEDYEQSQRTIIVATHLIEEISQLIEKVIIIDRGKILIDEDVESLLSKGYSVSGKASDVDAYIEGKEVLTVESLGGLKVAHLLSSKPNNIPESLEVTSISLQKIFIYLSEKGSVQDE